MRAQAISIAVHGGVVLAVVYLLKDPSRLPTEFTALVYEEPSEPEKKPPPPPPAKAAPPPQQHAAVARAGPRPSAAAAPSAATNATASEPVMDLGMLEADDGTGIPEGAVVVPAGPSGPGPDQAPAPPPKPAEQECRGAPASPTPLSRVDVEYPVGVPGLAGKVVARVHVAADGTVTAVDIVNGLEPRVDAAVRDSLLKWKFKAALRCGRAVEGEWTLSASFEPSE